MVSYRKANPADLTSVLELLDAHHLPTSDVSQHFDAFLVAEDGGSTVGCIGMEVYEPHALLRSLAVKKELQGLGIGNALYQQLVAVARSKRIASLHLLTTTAKNYFAKKGFAVTQRQESPTAIQATTEFSELCPSTATYMVKRIS